MPKTYAMQDSREYPDYEFREFPHHLGFDADGQDIVVEHADERAARIGDVVWPKHLGKDKHGKDVIAMTPGEEGWKSKTVVAPKEPEEVRRGPGRPPKSEAA
jgi:hypothetical protein